MEVRTDRRYTKEHEWALEEGEGRIRVGITDYAQDALGDVVFVELPEVGAHFGAEDTMAEVESTKSVAEVYAPVAGTIAEINQRLVENPELVNQEPYDAGWFVLIEAEDPTALEGLLDAAGYEAITA